MWEPIYNLNFIIRLQAVLKIVTNQTVTALDLLADQSTQMRNVILQHRMVLDYLLAEEGGVCGKLSDSNCCLQIDDNGKVVKQVMKEIRQLAHVPVQTWKGMDWDLFSWLPGGPWAKRMLFLFLFLYGVMMLLFIPGMIPCFTLLTRRIINSTQFVMTSVEKKGDVSIMMLKK
uniref:ENR1 protein n=1 Tax=Cairina moschata TaxID=8855 RepID=A0A8C3CR27_CAIMO